MKLDARKRLCSACIGCSLAFTSAVAFGQARPAAPAAKPGASPAAQTPATGGTASYQPGQAVEAREGDEWSKATVLKKEGRKIQIKYEDGTDEWVTADRLRAPGSGGPAAEAPAGPSSQPAARQVKKEPKEQFAIGSRIEVKEHSSWSPGVVKNRDGDLYLIATDRFPKEFFWFWAHASGIRKIGSSKEGPRDPKTVRVHSDIAKSKNEARKAFANYDEVLAADATRGDRMASAFEAAPYDKPIADVTNIEKVKDLLAVGAPAKLAVFDPQPSTKLSDRPVVIKGKGEWPNEAPSEILLGGGRALIPFYSGTAAELRTLRIELLDLVNGENLGSIKADPLSKPLDISPSGTRMVGAAHGFHTGTRKRLDVFDLPPGARLADDAEAKHVISFVPYVTAEYTWKDVEWARFIDDEHLVTCTWQGDVIAWEIKNAKALWRVKIAGGTYPALSPGRKQVAVQTPQGLAVVDATAGKVLCVVEGSRSFGSIAFSPDGKRLVGISGRTVCAWDLAEGKVMPEIGLPLKAAYGGVIALDQRFVLIGGSDLLDLDKKVVVWRYNGAGKLFLNHAGRCWMLSNEAGRHALASTTMPHAAAVKAADSMKPGEGLLIRPGAAVALSVAIEATPEQQQKIGAAITAQLQQQGIRVDAASPVKLIARTETGKTTEQEYRQLGRGPAWNAPTEKVAVTEKITRIFFEHEGKVAWESRTSSGTPMFVSAKEGQTIGQAVQAASVFNVKFLESVRVPAYVPAVSDTPWLGESTWTIKGIGNDRRVVQAPPKALVGSGAAAAAAPARKGDGLD
jgi:hypothetical protein